MKINIKKLNDDAIIPYQAHKADAGHDLFSIEDFILYPLQRKPIKTGIAVAIPEGYYGRVAPRSGLAVKNGIDVLAGVVDCFGENSLIKTIDGDKTIKDIKIDDIIYSVNDDFIIEKDFVSAIVKLEDKEMIKIETADGVIEITPTTYIYTKDGMKCAKDLKENDEILMF